MNTVNRFRGVTLLELGSLVTLLGGLASMAIKAQVQVGSGPTIPLWSFLGPALGLASVGIVWMVRTVRQTSAELGLMRQEIRSGLLTCTDHIGSLRSWRDNITPTLVTLMQDIAVMESRMISLREDAQEVKGKIEELLHRSDTRRGPR